MEDESARSLTRRLWLIGILFLALLVGATGAWGQTPANCPWINQATASGLLGGDASATFSDAGTDRPAVCTFTQKGPEVTRVLRISVETPSDPHAMVATLAKACGPDAAPLRGIGSEATVCTDRADGGPGGRVVGRVRDQVFTITLTSTQPGDDLLKRDLLRARIYTASEQVSGNLF